jgi:hypothetical protein
MREQPKLSPAKQAERLARDARLAAALRENLRRRKEQARGRSADRDASRGVHDDTPDQPTARDPVAGGLSGTTLSGKSGCAGGDTGD